MPAIKQSTVKARISPDIKCGAEAIFTSLGLSPSSAISLFYTQVKLHNGLPFTVEMPRDNIRERYEALDISKMTKEEFDAEVQKGIDSLENEPTCTAKSIRDRIHKRYAYAI